MAQALGGKENLEQFLNYESCRRASTLNPTTKTLNERLFNIAIADKYLELGQPDKATAAYIRSMTQESTRSAGMTKVVKALFELEEQGIEAAKGQACRIYAASTGTEDQEARKDYELELDRLAAEQCGSVAAPG